MLTHKKLKRRNSNHLSFPDSEERKCTNLKVTSGADSDVFGLLEVTRRRNVLDERLPQHLPLSVNAAWPREATAASGHWSGFYFHWLSSLWSGPCRYFHLVSSFRWSSSCDGEVRVSPGANAKVHITSMQTPDATLQTNHSHRFRRGFSLSVCGFHPFPSVCGFSQTVFVSLYFALPDSSVLSKARLSDRDRLDWGRFSRRVYRTLPVYSEINSAVLKHFIFRLH